MLLEIVSCKKTVDLEDNVILIDWAYVVSELGGWLILSKTM